MRLYIYIGGLVAVAACLSSIMYYQTRPSNNSIIHPNQKITVNGTTFNIAVATNPAQQTKGLGGITVLAPNQGMYFPLTGQTGVTFWMKGMVIPIDIIWIKQNSIISIDTNLSPPPPGTADDQLPLYSPPAPPDAVLEIAANRSQQLHLKTGDPIKLSQ